MDDLTRAFLTVVRIHLNIFSSALERAQAYSDLINRKDFCNPLYEQRVNDLLKSFKFRRSQEVYNLLEQWRNYNGRR